MPTQPRSRPRRRRDAGHIIVLEAFLVATVLLGAASYVTLARPAPAADEQAPLQLATRDALHALLAARTAGDEPLMDALVRDAWRCTEESGAAACTGPAQAAAAARLRTYLPLGVLYELEVADGAARVPLRAAVGASGPAVAAGVTHLPSWSYAVVAPTLSCHEAGADLRAEAVFLHKANAATARGARITVGAADAQAVSEGSVWSATLVAAPLAERVSASATASSLTVAGDAPLGACALGELRASLQAAMADASFLVAPVEPGAPLLALREVVIAHDLAAVAALAGVELESVALEIYAPSSGTSPTWRVPLGVAGVGSTSWSLPASALHGCYPLVLRAQLAVGEGAERVELEGARMGQMCVASSGGHVPIEPMYRIVLRAWMQDWGR